MTPRILQSLQHGLASDGWLASQALLVWGYDDAGVHRGLIIDGEHRWRAARAAGFKTGPMVVLDGLSEPAAKALTIKMNQKRGEWDDAALGELLRDIQTSTEGAASDLDRLGLDLGFDASEIDRLVTAAALPPPPPLGDDGTGSKPVAGDDPHRAIGGLVYGVVITCADEAQQVELYTRLQSEGLKVKPIIT